MKKLKYTKKIQNEFQSFQQIINNYCSKINKEYAKNMNKLLENIAKGEKLDIEMLKEKYLNRLNDDNQDNQDNKENVEEIKEEDTETTPFEEIIFDKIIIDGTNYYYENKENGKIVDASSKLVGVYKNKQFIFN